MIQTQTQKEKRGVKFELKSFGSRRKKRRKSKCVQLGPKQSSVRVGRGDSCGARGKVRIQ